MNRISKSDYEYILSNCAKFNYHYSIISKRNIHKVYKYKYSCDNLVGVYDSSGAKGVFKVSGLTNGQVKRFLGMVSKFVNDYIIKCDFNIVPIVNKNEMTTYWDSLVYNSLPVGETFYNIDLNSAWWQSMFRQGIIGLGVYDRYRNLYEYQLLRQVACGLTIAEKKIKYIAFDKAYNGLSISEDKTLHKLVYKNIRNYIYNLIFDICNSVRSSGSKVVGWNADSVFIKKEDLDSVKQYLILNKFDFKTVYCMRKAGGTYLHGRDVRRVRRSNNLKGL